MQNLQLVQEAAQELYKNKAGQIVALDVQGMTVICNYMLIAAGRTVNQVKALADDVDERMAELGVPIRRREGQNEGRWIILDYGFMLVHIFHTEEYEYYNLERLWTDGSNRLVLPFDQTDLYSNTETSGSAHGAFTARCCFVTDNCGLSLPFPSHPPARKAATGCRRSRNPASAASGTAHAR